MADGFHGCEQGKLHLAGWVDELAGGCLEETVTECFSTVIQMKAGHLGMGQ